MAISTRSRKQSKRKDISSVKEIPYDATCVSLDLPFSLACSICAKNIEKNNNLCGRGYTQKTNFRLLHKRNKCEQRWSEKFVSISNITNNQLLIHNRTCNFLNIPPLSALEYESYHHKRSKSAPKSTPTEKSLECTPLIRPNPKHKLKSSTSIVMNKKQLPTLSRQITPDFTSTNVISNKLKYISSESLDDYHHRINKQSQTKVINKLSILAEVAQVANNAHMVNNQYIPSDHVPHRILHSSAMHHNYEVMHHTLYDHHSAVEIPIPIPPQQSINQHQPPTHPISLSNALEKAFPKNSSTLSSEPWRNTSNKSFSPRHLSSSSNHIIILLRVLSSDNIQIALNLLNVTYKKLNELNPNKSSNVDENIADNIKQFINTNLAAKSNTDIDAKYAVAKASLGTNAVNYKGIKVRLGITNKIFNLVLNTQPNSFAYSQIDHSKELSTLKKLQRQCIYTFCHSDDSSRVDSNSMRCVKVLENGAKVPHVGRIWNCSTWMEKYALFLESQTLNSYRSLPNFKTPSISTLYKHHCPCLANPTVQSCVDIIKSKLFHYRKAIYNEVRTNARLKQKLHTCTCNLHRKEQSQQWLEQLNIPLEKFIYFACCQRVPHPSLKCEDYTPSFIQWDCANGICSKCGPNSLDLSSCPVLNDHPNLIKCNEWHLAPRPGSTTQLELGSFEYPLHIIIDKLHAALSDAIYHQANLRWKSHAFELDCTLSDPTTTLLVATDFGASLDLQAIEKDNCATDNHAAVCIMYVLKDWKSVEYNENSNDGIVLTKKKIISNCDRWIGFIDTLSKGKKNDYTTHHAFLDYILGWYIQNSEINIDAIKNIIVHTDNCPTQYKCRQNFNLNEQLSNKHKVTLVHKFAQKYGFKGPWDGTSKLIKSAISKQEMKYIRVANAADCHRLLSNELTQDNTDNPIWSRYIATKSPNILQKTTWKTDRTFVALGTEDRDEYNTLTTTPTSTGSKHIFFINRSPIQDIKPITNTQKIFQIQSTNNKKEFITSFLPCSCSICRKDPNDVHHCEYKAIRNIKINPIQYVPDSSDENNDSLNNMTVVDLKDICRAYGLSTGGLKNDLVARLSEFMESLAVYDDDAAVGLLEECEV